jgi:glycosyltransferase involved in cell wall biosynthesis
MTSAPLISIITPTYNHEKYIGACIQSVLDQTWTNWEMIIVNDGSTDQSSSLIKKFLEKDPRIHLFDRKNAGLFRLSETYNFALNQCKGDFIAILEGDDFWVKEKLEIQVRAMQEDPGSILCWGRATSVIENDPEVYETHPKCEQKNLQYYSNKPTGSFFNIVFDDFPAPLTFLIKKEALMKTGQFRQVLPFPAVDLPTILALSRIGPFHYIPRVLGSWRQHANQTTKNNSIQLLEGSTKIIMEHYGSLEPGDKKILNFDLPFILKNLKARRVVSYSRSGRFKLVKKMFSEARADYKKALLSGNPFTMPSWKLRSLVGLMLSWFKLDVEGLARILGKKSYK